MADTEGQRAYKRKRKKSFLTKQKQYGKKGRYGQGVELSEDSYQYFIRILEVIRASKENTEDLEMLASNVIDEISGKEVDTCSNQLASRAVEDLLPFAPDDKLVAFSNIFGSELRLVYTDPYCSHVLQKMAITLSKRVLEDNSKRSEETINQLKACLVRIAMFGLNNVEDFIFDQYANHVLRTLFACVNGNPIKLEVVGKIEETTEANPVVPEEFENISKSFVDKISSWPQFNDLTTQVLTSGCLQALLISVKNSPKLCKILVKKVLEACDGISGDDLALEKHSSFLYLVESSIVIAPPKLYHKIYELLFKENLKALALTKACNFAVQKLLAYCPVKETFDEIFDTVSDIFSDLLRGNYTGVIFAMAKTCRRLKTKQGEFSKLIFSNLHCDSPPERNNLCVPLIACMASFENYNAESSKVNLHGSLILQDMFYFTKPIRLVTSLLEMQDDQLVRLLSDPRGCHITDAFIASQYVGEKSRERLYKKLQRHYVALVSSKHGSRSFDAIWSCLNGKQKTFVMEELKAQQSAVVATLGGRIIALKTRLDLYRQDKDSWFKQFGATGKKEFNGQSKSKKEKNK